jgi:hypothetical protein
LTLGLKRILFQPGRTPLKNSTTYGATIPFSFFGADEVVAILLMKFDFDATQDEDINEISNF